MSDSTRYRRVIKVKLTDTSNAQGVTIITVLAVANPRLGLPKLTGMRTFQWALWYLTHDVYEAEFATSYTAAQSVAQYTRVRVNELTHSLNTGLLL